MNLCILWGAGEIEIAGAEGVENRIHIESWVRNEDSAERCDRAILSPIHVVFQRYNRHVFGGDIKYFMLMKFCP